MVCYTIDTFMVYFYYSIPSPYCLLVNNELHMYLYAILIELLHE